jgi:antitoxin (DNA-binding transcriptional repressor) of toxin-antitoxin stability system
MHEDKGHKEPAHLSGLGDKGSAGTGRLALFKHTSQSTVVTLADARFGGPQELKYQLGEWVSVAAAGNRSLVTDWDRVVAELIPPQAGTPETLSHSATHSATASSSNGAGVALSSCTGGMRRSVWPMRTRRRP